VLTALDEAAVLRAVETLLQQGCESLVIHFLHSYINPSHELRAAAVARTRWPNAYITVGHALVAEYREYERGVTACVNAAVQPALATYLTTLTEALAAQRTDQRPPKLLIMQGNGGTVAAEAVIATAVQTVMSGPASGVMAATATALAANVSNLITYDMGGTSTDVGVVRGGQPEVSSELELEYAMPLRVPLVDVHTVGAGGGSIAFINEAGMLQVGPRSAGAKPGPMCYGRGGTEPTITDANLLLGRLNPNRLIAVDTAVSMAAIEQVIMAKIGQPLGLDAIGAAEAILRIANDKMAGAIRMVSLARGHDPRDFTLFPFGGAGPLHACALARELDIPNVLIPARPGITNALGCALANLRHDAVNTLNLALHAVDIDAFHAILATQTERGRAALMRDGLPIESVTVLHAVDMQFMGQSHLLRVPLASAAVSKDQLAQHFADAYWQRFRVKLPEMRPVVVNLHTAVIGVRKAWPLTALAPRLSEPAANAQIDNRAVWFHGRSHPTPIYARSRIAAGGKLQGPAIIEQSDCTTVIEPGWRVVADAYGNLCATRDSTSSLINGGSP
jgi:N-methylhydantoinase A